jgi:hypothetical protein
MPTYRGLVPTVKQGESGEAGTVSRICSAVQFRTGIARLGPVWSGHTMEGGDNGLGEPRRETFAVDSMSQNGANHAMDRLTFISRRCIRCQAGGTRSL